MSFSLPELPFYPYDALAPYMSAKHWNSTATSITSPTLTMPTT